MFNLTIIGPYPDDPSKIQRGVEAVIINLIEGLKSFENMNLQVISCTPRVEKEVTRLVEGIKIHYLPSAQRFGNITFGMIDRRRIRAKIKEIHPDLIHNQYHFAYPYIVSKPLCPIITTVHGITYKEVLFETEGLDWVRKYPRVLLERFILRKFNHVICVTNYVKRSISHLTKAIMYVVENPVSEMYYNLHRRVIHGRILFVGSIIKRKNILDLLKAVNILKKYNVTLHIVGVSEETYYYNILQKYIKENALERNVMFLGNLPEKKLLEEYERCSLLALTSYEESAGIVLEQAMAAGIPVVATRIGGIPDIVKDSKCGFLVELGDIKGLADRIHTLLENRELNMEMGILARREAQTRFRPEIIAKATYDIYEKVLASAKTN